MPRCRDVRASPRCSGVSACPSAEQKLAPPKLTQLAGHGDRESMATYAARYLEWLLVKNYSPRTVENRESYLAFFIQWCEQRSLSVSAGDHEAHPGALSAAPIFTCGARTGSR